MAILKLLYPTNLEIPCQIFEDAMLKALADLSPASTTGEVKTPHLYLGLLDPAGGQETSTQILEDFPSVVDLKSILVSPEVASILTPSVSISIGFSLGSWLRTFHTWASAPAQAALREEIGKNEAMRELKYRITYGNFIEILENFPELLDGNRKSLQDVKDMARREFAKPPTDEEESWGLVHGDFWSGK